MRVLPTGVPEARTDRPTTAILFDEPNARIVSFHLLPGQQIPPHRNGSTVVVHVAEGVGLFQGEAGEVTLRTGDTAVFAPGEMHAMRPVDGALRFLAILAPRPR
jgi:quercetin dioxygenase-like cupin family protein